MKAVRVLGYGGPEVLQVMEVPEPAAGPLEVLVRVEAAGVNPVDTYIRAGNYGNRAVPPYTPGFDAAGVVEQVGAEVAAKYPQLAHLKCGARVYCYGAATGAYAQKLVAKPEQVWPLAEALSFEQGACLGVVYLTAYQALFQKAGLRTGERVLIHGGSGGVGLAAIQFAAAAGCQVVTTASTDAGRKLCRDNGAGQVLNHADGGYLDVLRAGQPFDVILENLANVNLNQDLGLLAMRGRVVVVGNRGTVTIDPRLTMGRDATVTGMALFNATTEELSKAHRAIGTGVDRGALRPVVHKTYPLADAAKAHHDIINSPAAGKLILVTK
jgi:NADPH2:quinone reductase